MAIVGLTIGLAAGTVPPEAGAGLSAGAEQTPTPSGGRSLPSVDSGHRPGPDALYAPPARAPQLRDSGPWHADPILVSGAQAYRDGEWLYQDFLYDDHGATGVPDDSAPYGPDAHLYSPTAGTYSYPKDPRRAMSSARPPMCGLTSNAGRSSCASRTRRGTRRSARCA
ncbi:MAG: hypothetical protein GEU97_14465 [Actinophytocola sp.]|nr:hypothetical protein [Actinophytocola sp.]